MLFCNKMSLTRQPLTPSIFLLILLFFGFSFTLLFHLSSIFPQLTISDFSHFSQFNTKEPGNDRLTISNSHENLVFWLQISDIHLSQYERTPLRMKALAEFAGKIMNHFL